MFLDLDGLACSFLLAPSDSFKYSALYGAILNVLHVVHQCEFHSVRKDKRDYSALCAVQYCFNAGWRLVQCLPPSVPVMEGLSTAGVELEPSALLHALLWGPRSAHKVYNAWITDCLVKQGLTTQKAIFVVKAAAKHANSTAFLVKVAKQLGQGMRQSSRLKDIAAVPDLWDVLVMDMVIARYNKDLTLNDIVFSNLFLLLKGCDFSTMNAPTRTMGMNRTASWTVQRRNYPKRRKYPRKSSWNFATWWIRLPVYRGAAFCMMPLETVQILRRWRVPVKLKRFNTCWPYLQREAVNWQTSHPPWLCVSRHSCELR